MPLPQRHPQLHLQPPINLDDRKRHKLDKKITEEGLRRRSSEVEEEVSSLEEIMVHEGGEDRGGGDPRFMTEARWKELERRQRQESSPPVVREEKSKCSLFPHYTIGASLKPPRRSSSLWLNRTRKLVVCPLFLLPPQPYQILL
jgi:hypothetical protein